MLIVIVGKMASGKTTLAKAMTERGYERIVTCTTRPPRDNETDEDYHFLKEEEYLELVENGSLVLCSGYNQTYYGVYLSDLIESIAKDSVIILDPVGAFSVSDTQIPCYVVWLDLAEDILVKRALGRGETAETITKRLVEDNNRFLTFAYEKAWDLRIMEEHEIDILVDMVIKTVELAKSSNWHYN